MQDNKFMLVSAFFKQDIPPLILGAFFSRYIFIENNKYIVAVANSKKSTKIEVPDFNFDEYLDSYTKILNQESGTYSLWMTKEQLLDNISLPKGQIFFLLENDLGISNDSFFNKLYAKILSDCHWVYDEQLTEDKKKFIRGYMELRGSIDTTANYIAQDYFYTSAFEIKKARLLVDYFSIPYYLVNINFRELQKEYYTDVNKRNTQLRLNILWYMQNVGIMNEYKAKIFSISRKINVNRKEKNIYYFDCHDTNHRGTNILDERLNYYSTNIFGKEITDEDIKLLRSSLGFDGPLKSIRNTALTELIRYFTPDECVSCKDKYALEDRTFINKKTGRPYFEIHHVISLGTNRELDDENNLVKLCPICHKTLKKGVATSEEQKEIITEIFKNAPHTLDFAKHIFDTNDVESIIDLTYNNLK